MRFNSRTEAYLYALYLLESTLALTELEENRIEAVIASIKIAIENHEQNPERVANLIDSLQMEDDSKLRILSAALKDPASYKKLSQEEKWEAPLARRLESDLHIQLLRYPTKKMLAVVYKASQKIVSEINKLPNNQKERFLLCLTNQNSGSLGFGSFKNKPREEEVISLLKENSPKKLSEIFFIHLQFSRGFSRNKDVIGESAEKAFQIADVRMYHSLYYKDRGRKGEQSLVFTSRLGLHISRDSFFKKGFCLHDSTWVADARSQQPDFNSPYVQSLIAQDTPYVAGPSGLTSLFMAAIYTFDFFNTHEEIQLYITCFASYIVAAGFHSLHEILGPIAYCLREENLIPGYLTSIPDEKNEIPSPLYHVFYDLIGKIDHEFLARREVGWHKTLSFFKDCYLDFASHLKKYNKITEKSVILFSLEEYEKSLNEEDTFSLSLIDQYKELISLSEENAFLWTLVDDFFELCDSDSLKEIMAKRLGFSSVDLLMSHVLFSRNIFALEDRLPQSDVVSVMQAPSF